MRRHREQVDPSMTVVDMVMAKHETTIEQIMPIVGAAGAALALEVLSQRAQMPKEQLAAMGAGIAYLAGMNAQGPARQLAMGVAAAGAGYSIVELLRSHRPTAIYGEPPKVAEPRQAAPVDAISRSDLEEALGGLSRKHNAEVESLRASYVELTRDMEAAHQTEVSDLRATIAALEEPRDAEPIVEENTAETEAEDPSKIQNVLGLLSIGEVAALQGLLKRLPPDELAAMEARVRPLPPEETVAFLRNAVLAGGLA